MGLGTPRGIEGIGITAAVRDRWPPIELIAAFFTRADLELPARAEFYPKPVHRDEIVAAMHRPTGQLQA